MCRLARLVDVGVKADIATLDVKDNELQRIDKQPTMSAAEEPDQKTLASANRRHRFVPSEFTELRRIILRFSSYAAQSI